VNATRTEDWIKTLSWGFPEITTVGQLRYRVAQLGFYSSKRTGLAFSSGMLKFLALPAAEAMPPDLLAQVVQLLDPLAGRELDGTVQVVGLG
jgi:hypothetical protein